MDLRTKKTQRAIREAFLQLRAKKPLERISVKELAELAEISKATFYLHYQDIYDLSEQLQQEAIQRSLDQISQPEDFLRDPMRFMQDFVRTFFEQREQTQVLFSGTQYSQFPYYIEQSFRQYYAQHFPHLRDDPGFQTYLSYMVYGGFYAFANNMEKFDRGPVLEALRDLTQALTHSESYLRATAAQE